MTTSLARQLKKLAAPQTTLLKLDKKKPSLLFDPKEAASLDRDVIFDIGLSGLEELEKLDPRFSEYRDSLFSLASKSFERSVQTAQVNRQVNDQIEAFLVLVSPYFTLRSAQKALEWLVNRYHIHQFNVDAWVMAVLPYHDANLFVRAIQLLYLKDEAGKWNWLRPLQKPGIPLPKGTLFNRCARDVGLLKLVCSLLEQSKKIHSGRPAVLATFVAFFTSTVIGMLEHCSKVSEEQLATLMPMLLAGLAGSKGTDAATKNPDLAAGCYMIVAQLTRKAQLSPKATEDLAAAIIKGMTFYTTLTLEAVTMLVVLGDGQKASSAPLAARTSSIFNPSSVKWKKSAKTLLFGAREQLVSAIETLAGTYRVSPFVSPLVESFLMELGNAGSTVEDAQGRQIDQFLSKLVDQVRFQGQDTTDVISSFVNGYLASLNQPAMVKNPESRKKLQKLVKNVLDQLERQYPVQFERVLHLAMSEEGKENGQVGSDGDNRKEEVRRLFGANWDVDHTSLFLKLNHNSAEVRAEAVDSLVKALQKNKVRNMSFAVLTATEKLTDSSPLVVGKLLQLGEKLLTLLPAEERFQLLLKSLTNIQALNKDWHSVRICLVHILCGKTMSSSLNEEQQVELFAAILPYLVPLNMAGVKLTRSILGSAFASTCSPLMPALTESMPALPGDGKELDIGTLCSTMQAVIVRTKPFISDQMNSKLFELIISRLKDPSTHASWTVPALWTAPALVGASSTSALAATRFLTALCPLLRTAKLNQQQDQTIQSSLRQAAQNGTLVLDALLRAGLDAMGCITVDTTGWTKRQWVAQGSKDEADFTFLLTLFRFLASGLTSKASHLFQEALKKLFDVAERLEAKIFFLGLVWNDSETPTALRAAALKMAALLMTGKDVGWAIKFESSVIPQLLCCLTCQDPIIRQEAFTVLKVLGLGSPGKKGTSFGSLIEELKKADEEIKLDAAQLKIILSSFFSKTSNGPISTALFNTILSPTVPDHIKEGLLRALELVNSVKILTNLLPLIDQLVEVGQPKEEAEAKPVAIFNRSRSGVLTMLLERFNVDTASILVNTEGWNSFQKALRCSTCFIMAADDPSGQALIISPQDILIEVISKDFFRAVVSQPVQLRIFGELLDIVTKTDRTVTGRQARKALKRISYDATLLAQLLDFKSAAAPAPAQQPESATGRELRSGVKPATPPKATGRRQRMSMAAQPKPSQSPVWCRMLAILEMLQAKKGIDKVQLLIAPLFELLKSCLSEEEQAPLEYSKQLILSSLLSCCQKLPAGESVKLAAEFNTGLIVQCVRVSANPQTHHQALLLLSLAAQLFPSHVLHNIMAIFTFMGTSVLRQDDAYSFQVIAKTLESVVPALIEASSRTAVEPVVTTVVHVFADALPEVPEHRRLPVFDKLLTTLDPQVYLWLAPTLILSNMATQGPRLGRGHHKEDADAPIILDATLPNAASAPNRERVIADVEFSLSVCHLYKPQVQLTACIRMLEYLKTLPAEKDERLRITSTNRVGEKDMTEGSTPFALEGPTTTTRQLCYFKLHLSSFISSLLASNRLIEQLVELDDVEKPDLEPLYRELVQVALEYTQIVSVMSDAPSSNKTLLSAPEAGASSSPGPRFWKTLLHRCYDIIDRINSLLPRSMFLSVVHSLLSHKILSVRRRSMELLSAKLQHQSGFFSLSEDEEALLQLVPALTNIARGLQDGVRPTEEVVLNQQTAFYTLKLLCRLMGPSHSAAFRPVLDAVVDIISLPINSNVSAKGAVPFHVPASAFLCLAELISTMGVQSLPSLPRYGAQLVARLEGDVAVLERYDLLLLSVVTAVAKLVETLPQFLLPYLPTIIKQICHLSAKQPACSTEKPSLLHTRLQSIRHSLATSAVPRSLVSSITQVFGEVTGLVDSSAGRPPSFTPSLSIGPLMSILSESFAAMSREELTIQLPALTSFFLKALDARSLISCAKSGDQKTKTEEDQVGRVDEVDAAEEPVVTALVSLVLKLSEASFRPLFFQLYDWATRLPTDGRKERLVSFYVSTLEIADKLKGLFVAFAGHFIRNAAQVLAETNWTLAEGKLPFTGPRAESNTLKLLDSVLRVLYRVCLHDNEHFINKERFETLMEPLVEQLDNQLGGEEASKIRVKTLLVPLLAQLAVAAGDDHLWKALHYQLLLKTRSNAAQVRLGSLDALAALVEKLGEDYLALLPEAIPFLAELLEDDVDEVEAAALSTIAHMEEILGEPLQKYF